MVNLKCKLYALIVSANLCFAAAFTQLWGKGKREKEKQGKKKERKGLREGAREDRLYFLSFLVPSTE